jgi:phage baseplate assembly protein W
MSNNWTGISLPFSESVKDTFAQKGDMSLLKTSVRMILLTLRGERMDLPVFGSNLKRLLFEQVNNALLGRIDSEVRGAIQQQDSRIGVSNMTVDYENNNTIVNIHLLLYNKMDPLSSNSPVPYTITLSKTS